MAKKRAGISDLIKSDMSRRAIGEETKTARNAKAVTAEKKPLEKKMTEKKAPPKIAMAETVAPGPAVEKPVVQKPAVQKTAIPAPAAKAGDSGAAFLACIEEQARGVGLTDAADLHNLYAFLQGQAARYIRGFDAGRRFHG
jgi:hypothetical protein